MFGIGETELAIILIFAFLLFGPDKLPGMGRTIGRALRQFRDAQEGFTEVVQSQVMDPLNDAMNDPDEQVRKKAQRRKDALTEDADLDNESVPKKRQNETFAERKARLEAERKAREAQEAEGAQEQPAAGDEEAPSPEDAAPTGADAADSDAPSKPVGQEADATEPAQDQKPPATSAAALWAMRPKRKAEATPAEADSDADVDAAPQEAAPADVDSDADIDAPAAPDASPADSDTDVDSDADIDAPAGRED